jgi:Periplasmic binding protein
VSDLEAAIKQLVDHPMAPPPPVEQVAVHARRLRRDRVRNRSLMALALILLASTVRVVVDDKSTVVVRPADAPPTTVGNLVPPGDPGPPVGTPAPAPDPAPSGPPPGSFRSDDLGPQATCAPGRNGGATDKGVTGTRIKLFVNATLDGPLRYTSEAAQAMKGVVDEVNKAGGICGRLLETKVVNGFHPPPDDTLAAMTMPMREELDAYIADGSADRLGVPMVGTDGLANSQFRSRWIWPVGAPVDSLVRIAVSHAYHAQGARTFALVHDAKSDYGMQAAASFRDHVATLPGASIRVVQPVDGPVAGAVNSYNEACRDDRCDSVVWAMLPLQARDWLRAGAASSRLWTSGLYYELDAGVLHECGDPIRANCENLHIWSAFDEADDDQPWPWLASAHVGTKLLVAALERVGPILTRERLRQALDGARYELPLTGPMQWGPRLPLDRVGNPRARAVRVVPETGRAGRVEDAGTGWVADPTPGRFPS